MITLGELDYDEALRYMGVKKGKADANTLAMLPQCEQLVIKNSIPRYRYGIFDIEKQTWAFRCLTPICSLQART